MKKFIIALLVIIVVVVGGFYAAISIPKEVKVEWSEEDWQSYLEKGNITFTEDRASIDDILTGNYQGIGAEPIDTFVTNEEVSAMINMTTKETGLFQDVNMRFLGDDRMEVSGTIGDNIDTLIEKYPEVAKYEKYLAPAKGKTVYMKTTLKNVTGNNFEAHVEDLRLGNLPLPEKVVNKNMTEVGTMANNILDKIEGLNIEKFDITEEGFHYKGTIPTQIQSLP